MPSSNGSQPDTSSALVQDLVDHLFRHKAGQMVAILTSLFGVENLDLAEDVVQETLIKALRQWPYRVPDNPGGWLVRVAKNHALDVLRRESQFQNRVRLLVELPHQDADLEGDALITDEQLTMIFICCHPALPREAQIALTLKTVGGFGVPEIAHAFLVPEATVAQRLVRAKRRLREEQTPFAMPDARELPARLDVVLEVLYLLFNEGYSASQGEALIRRDLCAEAIRLGGLLTFHEMRSQPKVHALLALMLFQTSRLNARVDDQGNLLLLAEQDRGLWDRDLIQRGYFHLERAMSGPDLTDFHLQAGIAACHAAAPSYEATDWKTILFYYDQLIERTPSPVVALNRAVAVSMLHGPEAGIAALEGIAHLPALRQYYRLPATYGELARRAGDLATAAEFFRAALSLIANEAERRFIARKAAQCESPDC